MSQFNSQPVHSASLPALLFDLLFKNSQGRKDLKTRWKKLAVRNRSHKHQLRPTFTGEVTPWTEVKRVVFPRGPECTSRQGKVSSHTVGQCGDTDTQAIALTAPVPSGLRGNGLSDSGNQPRAVAPAEGELREARGPLNSRIPTSQHAAFLPEEVDS